jgi:hypothetical protein
MWSWKRKDALLAVLLLTGLPAVRANNQEAGGLTLAEFQALKPALDLRNQPWATIPWKYSITEARRLAAAEY